MTTKVLRKFSMAGPCLTQGTIVGETKHFWIFTDRWSKGRERRLKKSTLVHTEPCHRCTDHPETSYPWGYMD